MSFKRRIEETSRTKKTDIVLALDFPFQSAENRTALLEKAQAVLGAVQPYVCAVKINHHLTLPLGIFDGVQTLIETIHRKGLLAIMDCKANDIGNTNQIIAEYYFDAGFDALIVNPFVGWDDGLQPIFDVARQQARGVILLTYMSHKGAIEGYRQVIIDPETGVPTPQYVSFARKALIWNADGAVVGATVPDKIHEIHKVLGESVPIYSPGVGAQGGVADAARKAGSRFLIVGREIIQAQNPGETARKLTGFPRN